jgi:hypothetical protein
MDIIHASDLQQLLEEQPGFCTSIYQPTHVVGPNAPDDTVRLKNLVNSAKGRLIEQGLRASDVRKSLERIEDLTRDVEFWDRRGQGLAVFLSDETFTRFRLGAPVEEAAVVGRRFYVKPLLPFVSADDRFSILAVSQNRVRLLQATLHTCESVKVKGLPTNLKETLNLVGADRGQQVHTATHFSTGKQGAVFHGQGGVSETAKEELVQYFREIDAVLRPMLQVSNRPLILAAVESAIPLFREVCGYKPLADESLVGNFDYAAEHEIHAQALPIAQRIFTRDRTNAAARYQELANTERASDRLDVILPAALEGRVETLFVDVRASDPGVYHPATGFISYGGKNGLEMEDLLDRVAVESLVRRGDVYAVPREQMPCNSEVAAIFRY